MTIQSKHGPNAAHAALPTISLSPADMDIVIIHRTEMHGSGAALVGYHKRRQRSAWQWSDGNFTFFHLAQVRVLDLEIKNNGT